MDTKHIQELVKVNSVGEVQLYNAKITSDVLKGLRFPPYTKTINLSQNQITTLEGVRKQSDNKQGDNKRSDKKQSDNQN